MRVHVLATSSVRAGQGSDKAQAAQSANSGAKTNP